MLRRWFDCDDAIVHVHVHVRFGEVVHVEKKKVLPSWLLKMNRAGGKEKKHSLLIDKLGDKDDAVFVGKKDVLKK